MSSSLYDFIAKAHAAKSPQAVRRLKSKAEFHLSQAKLIGLRSLEQSWEQEVEVIDAILQAKEQRKAA